jgi:hypothetical protein
MRTLALCVVPLLAAILAAGEARADEPDLGTYGEVLTESTFEGLHNAFADHPIFNGFTSFDALTGDDFGKPFELRPRHCYVQIDSLWLQRNDSDEVTFLGLDVFGTTGFPNDDIPLITTETLDLEQRAGPRVIFGVPVTMDTFVEATYFFNQNGQSQGAEGFDDLDVPFRPFSPPLLPTDSTDSFDNADLAIAHYDSRLHNAEVGIRHWVSDRLSVLVGARYFHLDEQFQLLTFDGVLNNIAEFNHTHGRYEITTDNEMVGGQIGGNLIVLALFGNRVVFDIGGKAGVLANFARTDQLVTDVSDTVILRNSHDEDDDVAFIGEVSATATIRITDCIAVRGGFFGMWLNGVAVAPDQADFSPAASGNPDIDDNGDVFYQGGFVGVELRR